MYRHDKVTLENKADSNKSIPDPVQPKLNSDAGLRDLLEKNLKWSQIIYEQNRKINNKLLWSAIAGWLRFFIILAPIFAAVWYLPPVIKNFKNTYQQIIIPGLITRPALTIEELLKLLPPSKTLEEQARSTPK